MPDRISEPELILPALWCMANHSTEWISTSDLILCLRQLLTPIGEDLEILSGRNDDKFSQKVRNLRSHKTLERLGFAEYQPRGRNGDWRMSAAGRQFLGSYQALLTHCIDSGFKYGDVREVLRRVRYTADQQEQPKLLFIDEGVEIREGERRRVTGEITLRSARLREAAIQHYSVEGTIICSVCRFDFEAFYGNLGEGFIQIHHLKPIVAYEDEDIQTTVAKALANVRPVCPNCHSMIHRSRNTLLSIEELKQRIATAKRQ